MVNNDDYMQVLLESLENKFEVLTGLLIDIHKRMVTNQEFAEELRPMEDDLHAIKVTLTAHSYDLNDHERRISRLEMASESP